MEINNTSLKVQRYFKTNSKRKTDSLSDHKARLHPISSSSGPRKSLGSPSSFPVHHGMVVAQPPTAWWENAVRGSIKLQRSLVPRAETQHTTLRRTQTPRVGSRLTGIPASLPPWGLSRAPSSPRRPCLYAGVGSPLPPSTQSRQPPCTGQPQPSPLSTPCCQLETPPCVHRAAHAAGHRHRPPRPTSDPKSSREPHLVPHPTSQPPRSQLAPGSPPSTAPDNV